MPIACVIEADERAARWCSASKVGWCFTIPTRPLNERVVEGGDTIYAYGSDQDISTAGSTLYQLGDGAILSL